MRQLVVTFFRFENDRQLSRGPEQSQPSSGRFDPSPRISTQQIYKREGLGVLIQENSISEHRSRNPNELQEFEV